MSSSFALLNLEVYAYLSISLKRLFDLFLEIKKKNVFLLNWSSFVIQDYIWS